MSERFTISPLGVNGGSLVLGDDSITSPRQFILAPAVMNAPEIQIETWMPFRANNAKSVARGGCLANYSWTVTRFHGSITEAIRFSREHVTEILNSCAFGQFVLTRTAFNVALRSTGALKMPRQVEALGEKTSFTYEWIGTPFT